MSFLGLDIGTSNCKAVVFDSAGKILSTASRSYSVESPQAGWAELNSQNVGDLCLEIIAEGASRCQNDPVEGLAISSQGEAFTVLDSDGVVISNAMVSSDSRALEQVRNSPFDPDQLYQKTGHTPHPIFSLYKILWLKKNKPELWKRIGKIFCFEDYLHYRLGVDPGISLSLAARTMLLNVRDNQWDDQILAACDLHPSQLSRPLAPGQPVGRIPAALCKKLYLAPGALVVAGGHDQVCAALGSGAYQNGIAALGSGTVECIVATFSSPIMSPSLQQSNFCTYSHAAPGLFASLAYNLSGGNVLQWFKEEWSRTEVARSLQSKENVYDLILASMPEAPTSLMVLPYFTSSGTPHFDSQTPAAILGLRLNTTRGEVLKGILEGMAFELACNLRILERSGIRVDELRITGGGAKNQRWLQLKSDIFNRPIQVPAVTEAGCLGVAMLACAAVDLCDLKTLASRWIQTGPVIHPDPRRSNFYQEKIGHYEEAYQALKPLSQKIFS